MQKTKTFLVVDDEVKIAEVIKSYLEKEGYQVICAYDGIQALRLFNQHTVTFAILDLMLPGMSGEELCREIRKKSRVPIIMLTAKVEEENILKGLEIGADDYMTKPFSPRQLLARIDAIQRRVSAEAVPLAKEFSFDQGSLIIDGLRHQVRKNGEDVSLTPNEYKILATMAKYPTKTFTREELISLAFADKFEGYDRIIDTHIKNLRQKLEDDPKNPKYILTVHGIGYKFGGK